MTTNEKIANEITNEQEACPDCGGDGIETCNNPDHGFLNMIGSVVGANESSCPCCGHSSDHKISNSKCPTCLGTGKITKNYEI